MGELNSTKVSIRKCRFKWSISSRNIHECFTLVDCSLIEITSKWIKIIGKF